MSEPLFLQSVMQEKIWGGTHLRDVFGYDIPSDHVGEYWAISAHPNGVSTIKNGRYAGQTLDVLYAEHRELFGNRQEPVFPLLTKILDANDWLSVECGYEVFEAGDGQEALDLFHREAPDLVLLDIQLPILNGLEVLKTIRKTSSVPVLMLTAFHDEDYKLTAFGELADGYLEKPFSLSLLKVRIEAIFKKLQPSRVFTYGEARVDFESYTASLAGQAISMNAKELEILEYLLQHEGKARTRSQILDAVWKETEEIPFDRVIDVYIKELRKKLELDCIVTVRNVGYKLERP